MYKSKKRLMWAGGLAFAGVFLQATSVSANSTPPQGWYLNPGLSYQWQDGDRNLKNTSQFGLGVEHRFTERFAAELSYWRGDADGNRFSHWVDPIKVDYDTLRMDGLYYIQDWRWGSLTPYWHGGIGYGRFESRTIGSVGQGWQVHTGPGLSLELSPRWRLQTDIRPTFNRDGSYWDFAARAALSFRLSGQAAQQQVNLPAAVTEEPKPLPLSAVEEPKVETQSIWVTQVLTHELVTYFEVGSYRVAEEYKQRLGEVADFMRLHPDSHAIISGHTDNTGSALLNERLSSQRAEAVAQYLTQTYGIAPERLEVKNYGFSKPIADNNTEAGRELNRRTEVQASAEVQVEVKIEQPAKLSR